MQNCASASAEAPHSGQLRSSLVPQAMQNCAAGGFSTAQFPQMRAAFIVRLMMTAAKVRAQGG
jgi:hypothetical protein